MSTELSERLKASIALINRQHRRERADMLKRAGLCRDCGKRNSKPGRVLCPGCTKTRVDRARRKRTTCR
jgi:hypothetical protein